MTVFKEFPKPKCYDRLHELQDEEWDALWELYRYSRDPSIPDLVRGSLTQKDLILGDSLTEEGRRALHYYADFLDPWDYSHDGKIYKSCAVVASDGAGHDVLLHAYGPAINWHCDRYGGTCDELELSAPEAGVWIWTGSMGSVRVDTIDYGCEYELQVQGGWRKPTDEEWELIKEGECPWTKETLPKWKD